MNTVGTLAKHVDYRRLAVQAGPEAGRVGGVLSISQLPRIAAEMQRVPDERDTIEVDLRFREDAERRVRVHGRISAVLALCCQRCLDNYEQPVTAEVAGVIVGHDSAAASVPREDEPIEAEDDWLDLWMLVSDELLLALPAVSRCDRPDCRARYEHDGRDRQAQEPDARKRSDNPFAILSTLKRDN